MREALTSILSILLAVCFVSGIEAQSAHPTEAPPVLWQTETHG